MANTLNDFTFEYEYTPSPDAEEKLDQVWDIIFALILKDIESEQQEDMNKEIET